MTPLLDIERLCVAHPALPDRRVVDELSFAVHGGEVVALAGALGAGRTAVLSALAGWAHGEVGGAIRIAGRAIAIETPRDARAAGIAFVPEDRQSVARLGVLAAGEWLAAAPRIVLVDEPTRGASAATRAELVACIERLRAAGHAIVLASSDLREVAQLADRVLVLRAGRLAGALERSEISQLAIMQLAMGTLSAALAQEAIVPCSKGVSS